MPNFSHPRHIVLNTLMLDPSSTLQTLMRVLGIRENYTAGEYLRVHKLVSRLLRDGFILRASNPRHGLTTYSITSTGIAALDTFNKRTHSRTHQEMNSSLTRKKQDASETPDDPPVRVTPVVSAAPPPSLDVVRCPSCNFVIPASEVRHSLHVIGTANCPKCRHDLSDAIGGTPEI